MLNSFSFPTLPTFKRVNVLQCSEPGFPPGPAELRQIYRNASKCSSLVIIFSRRSEWSSTDVPLAAKCKRSIVGKLKVLITNQRLDRQKWKSLGLTEARIKPHAMRIAIPSQKNKTVGFEENALIGQCFWRKLEKVYWSNSLGIRVMKIVWISLPVEVRSSAFEPKDQRVQCVQSLLCFGWPIWATASFNPGIETRKEIGLERTI